MPLPSPRGSEKQDEFVSRCMSEASGEFADEKQRAAVCHSQWRKAKKEELVEKTFRSLKDSVVALAEIDVYRSAMDELEEVSKAVSIGGFESPEPGELPEAGAKLLAKVYASCRKDGGDKEKCARIAWGAVGDAGYKAKGEKELLERIQELLGSLALLQDEEVGKAGAKPGEERKKGEIIYQKQQDGSWRRARIGEGAGEPAAK
jgi:hypothetical protein